MATPPLSRLAIPPRHLYGGGVSLTSQISTADPATVNDENPTGLLGDQLVWKGNRYRYVKFDNGTGNVAAVAGGAVHWFALDPAAATPLWTVTSDQTDALMTVNGVAGILGNIMTDQFHGWIQIGGRVNAQVAAGVAIGDLLVGGTTDLTLEEQNATYVAHEKVIGTAITAVSAGFSQSEIDIASW